MRFSSLVTLPWMLATTALSSSLGYLAGPRSAIDIIKAGVVVHNRKIDGSRYPYNDLHHALRVADTKEYTRYICAGPVTTDERLCTIVDGLNNPNLAPIMQTVALYDLSENGEKLTAFTDQAIYSNGFADSYKGTSGGFHEIEGNNIIIDSSHWLGSEQWIRGTTAHELTHKMENILDHYKSVEPYTIIGDSEKQAEFAKVMHDVLFNLHRQFLPSETIPSDIKDIAKALSDKIFGTNKQEQAILKIFSSFFSIYNEKSYRPEFVVRFAEIIAKFGDLPPYIREAFAPIELYYKNRITPMMNDYIEQHPQRENLLTNSYEQYYPETILSHAGETLLKKKTSPTEAEARLIKQMQEMEQIIRAADSTVKNIQDKILELKITDERVIRDALTQSIKQNRADLFHEIFKSIQAPEYLGAQLVRAAELNNHEIALKLAEKISNQYYLAKAAEISLEKGNNELVSAVTEKIYDPWFLKRSLTISPDNEYIKQANIMVSNQEVLDFVNGLDETKRELALGLLKNNAYQAFIHDSKNLNYLVKMNDQEREDVLERKVAIEADTDGPFSFLRPMSLEKFHLMLDFVNGLDETKRELTLGLLKNNAYQAFIYDSKNLNYLVKLNDQEREDVLERKVAIDADTNGPLSFLRPMSLEDFHIALRLLEHKDYQAFIRDSKNLNYLVKLNDQEREDVLAKKVAIDADAKGPLSFLRPMSLEDFHSALKLLKNPVFDYLVNGSILSTKDIVKYFAGLDSSKKENILKIIGNRSARYFMRVNGYDFNPKDSEKLKYLQNLEPKQLDAALSIISNDKNLVDNGQWQERIERLIPLIIHLNENDRNIALGLLNNNKYQAFIHDSKSLNYLMKLNEQECKDVLAKKVAIDADVRGPLSFLRAMSLEDFHIALRLLKHKDYQALIRDSKNMNYLVKLNDQEREDVLEDVLERKVAIDADTNGPLSFLRPMSLEDFHFALKLLKNPVFDYLVYGNILSTKDIVKYFVGLDSSKKENILKIIGNKSAQDFIRIYNGNFNPKDSEELKYLQNLEPGQLDAALVIIANHKNLKYDYRWKEIIERIIHLNENDRNIAFKLLNNNAYQAFINDSKNMNYLVKLNDQEREDVLAKKVAVDADAKGPLSFLRSMSLEDFNRIYKSVDNPVAKKIFKNKSAQDFIGIKDRDFNPDNSEKFKYLQNLEPRQLDAALDIIADDKNLVKHYRWKEIIERLIHLNENDRNIALKLCNNGAYQAFIHDSKNLNYLVKLNDQEREDVLAKKVAIDADAKGPLSFLRPMSLEDFHSALKLLENPVLKSFLQDVHGDNREAALSYYAKLDPSKKENMLKIVENESAKDFIEANSLLFYPKSSEKLKYLLSLNSENLDIALEKVQARRSIPLSELQKVMEPYVVRNNDKPKIPPLLENKEVKAVVDNLREAIREPLHKNAQNIDRDASRAKHNEITPQK